MAVNRGPFDGPVVRLAPPTPEPDEPRPYFDDVDETLRYLFEQLEDAVKKPWTVRNARCLAFYRWAYATGRLTD